MLQTEVLELNETTYLLSLNKIVGAMFEKIYKYPSLLHPVLFPVGEILYVNIYFLSVKFHNRFSNFIRILNFSQIF